ncbi:hypothetical protein N7468_008213 [Penicillium chermesinum]|uniref:NAP family protein n=1 Tax=Penicillium chermesinum TaxID=63820 RepID=A0A9W9TI56_9EURO|nr:uncharacterized protein N7468_008213 [Penicillium chermesinum]KAJ5223671.1 hypothetical protein N7468_008213 [Penicillium chermesinum]
MSADQALEERIEVPSIPVDAQRKIAHLGEEFARAEVEQKENTGAPQHSPSSPLCTRSATSRSSPKPPTSGSACSRAPPAEIDEYILPVDAQVLGDALQNMKVERFELNDKGEGEPRSLRFIFDFKENDWFTNTQLVKDFYWRTQIVKTESGKSRTWEGLVSDPVRINWKEGKDVTKGLLDATVDLFEAEKKAAGKKRAELPQYETLVKKIQEVEAEALDNEPEEDEDDEDADPSSPVGVSFWNWFGYRGRDVSAEESAKATKEDNERFEKILKGEKVDGDENDDDDEDDEDYIDDLEDAEVFEDGQDLAIALAEDLYADAMQYYVQSFEMGDDLDDLDIEDLEALENLEDQMDEDEDEAEGEGEESRPRKKARN